MPNVVTNDSSANTVCVVPLYAVMDASGEASIETLIQQSVSMAYDLSFNATITKAEAAKIANAFTVTGGASVFAVGMDDSKRADFESALAAALVAAVDAAGLNLQKVIYNDAKNTLKDVYSDLLANLLESNWSLNTNVAWATGAANMYADLSGADAGIRAAVARQLPESNYSLYMDASENPTTDALPLKGGDTIVFLFDVRTAVIARANSKVPATSPPSVSDPAGGATGSGTVTDAAGSAYTQPYGTGLVQSYSGRNDIVAFFITVAESGALTLKESPSTPANLIAGGSGPGQGY
jgi:hypothetical protein